MLEHRDLSFRPRTAVWLLAGSWLVIAGLGVGQVVANDAAPVRVTLVAAALGAIAWLLLWVPKVEVGPLAITVVNPLRTFVVPWAALIDVRTAYALTLVTPGRTVTAWAAPGPGRHIVVTHAGDLKGVPKGAFDNQESVRIGELPDSLSGGAASIVRGQWEHLVEAEQIPLGEAEATPVTIHLHTVPLVVTGVLVAAAAVALALR